MRWEDFRRSENVEDYRGGGGGGGFGIPMGGGGLGIGTMIILGVVGWLLGIDPRILISGADILTGGSSYQQPQQQPRPRDRTQPNDQASDFMAAVLGSTEDTWQELFRESGRRYRPPRLRLFSGAIQGGCGFAQAAMGPFYCPSDQRIYIDTSFFRQLEERFRGCSGKACQFSYAYVLAHEVGHHIQNLLGILPQAQQAQQASGDRVQANRIQVRVELQADCLAGVWANRAEKRSSFLDPGDIDAALQTASAIGDDNLQRGRGRGAVVPESFTHGSAEQRKRWFTIGFREGRIDSCNTFRRDVQL